MTTFPQPMKGDEVGAIRVNGMKFHMSGEWRMEITLNGAAGEDRVTFDIVIEPSHVKNK